MFSKRLIVVTGDNNSGKSQFIRKSLQALSPYNWRHIGDLNFIPNLDKTRIDLIAPYCTDIIPNFDSQYLNYRLAVMLLDCLSVKPNDVIWIDKPERDLSPQTQARLLNVLLKLAQERNFKIILETHSDHIVNGLLVQCKKYEENEDTGISKEDVVIKYINRDKGIIDINIEEGGRIRYTPKGFFDQFTLDRKFLMGF